VASQAAEVLASGALSVNAMARTKTIRAMKRSDMWWASTPPANLLSRRVHYRLRAPKGKAELA
jgi:hypothetical protein